MLGIRDYGDRGVVEFVLCELVRLLHGFDRPMWRDLPLEITGLKAGIVGLGVSGTMIADALCFMGADVRYYSRTRKPEKEAEGMNYQPLPELLSSCDVVFTCLNKNVILMDLSLIHIFGESFVCGDRTGSTVSFQAASDCRILLMNFHKVLRTCGASCVFHHRLVENMVTLLAQKNIQLMDKMEVISKKTIRGRILVWLSQQVQRQGSRRFVSPMGLSLIHIFGQRQEQRKGCGLCPRTV